MCKAMSCIVAMATHYKHTYPLYPSNMAIYLGMTKNANRPLLLGEAIKPIPDSQLVHPTFTKQSRKATHMTRPLLVAADVSWPTPKTPDDLGN